MPLWLQHLLALALVVGCVAWITWQGFQSLRGRGSKIGSCCAKGCTPPPPTDSKRSTERIVFMPVEMLTRRRP